MFALFPREDPALDAAIAAAFEDLKDEDADTERYAKITKQLSDLYALKPKPLSPDTFLTVLGNAFVAISVIKYEQTGIITTKVAAFLMKSR